MKRIGVLVMLTLPVALWAASSTREFDAWFEGAFASMHSTFERAWESAFENSWDQSFAEHFDDETKAQFRKTFREAFEREFVHAFEHAIEGVDSDEWEETSEYNPDRVRWDDVLIYEQAANALERLDLSTVNGEVRIVGEDTDTVRIRAHRVVRSTDEAEGRRYRDGFRPTLRVEGGALTVETRFQQDRHDAPPRHVKEAQMSYEAVVPMRFAVNAKTVNGSVNVTDVLESAALHTVNGNVELTTQEAVEGSIRAKTVNGKILVTTPSVLAASSFETVNGNVELATRERLDAPLHAKTLNGSIRLISPRDAAFNLNCKVGMHGSIDTDWGKPTVSRKERIGPRFGASYQTSVEGGGERVDLTTFNGSIRVHRAE